MKKYTAKLLVILGSTSTGKTDLALKLAKKFNGELISCDSRQVYKGLDIGTGKLPGSDLRFKTACCRKVLRTYEQVLKIYDLRIKKSKGCWEINNTKIWMYDVVDPRKKYTVYDYVKDANQAIEKIIKRGKLPIIVGGTGLYLKALLEGLPNLDIPIDLKLRKELDKLCKEELQNKLKQISLDRWDKLNESDKQNPRRLIRAIEIIQNSKFKSQKSKLQFKSQNYQVLKIGLTAPREVLYQRIDKRVIERLEQGMIEEARRLRKEGLSFKRMKQLGLEYGILADFLKGNIKSSQELTKVLQGKIHGYARRQITWFKKTCLPAGRKKNVFWFDITENSWLGRVESQVNSWYYSLDD